MIKMVEFQNTRRLTSFGDFPNDCIVLRRYDGQKVEMVMPFEPDIGILRFSASEALSLLSIIDHAHVLTSPDGRSKISFLPFGEEMHSGSYCLLIRGNNHYLEIDMGFSDFLPIYLQGREIFELKQALKEIIAVKWLPLIGIGGKHLEASSI